MPYNFGIRLWVIIVAVFAALACVSFMVKPWVLEPLCLINSNECMEIEYWTLENSVIAHMQPTGYWIWYNGENVYVFGEQTGQLCEDPNYEPAYVIDVVKNEILGYECVMPIEDILKYYTSQGSETKYLFKRITQDQWSTFNVYDLINTLIDNNIIYVVK